MAIIVNIREKVINLFSFIADEVREILGSLGFSSLDEVVGRSDLLYQVSRGSSDLDDLDLNPIIQTIDSSVGEFDIKKNTINKVSDSLDIKIIEDAKSFFETDQKIELNYNIKNTDRAIGTRLASEITTTKGMSSLPEDFFTVNFHGSAGQSFGAWSVQGTTLKVFGDANDYVAKGLSGGKIVIQPSSSSQLKQTKMLSLGILYYMEQRVVNFLQLELLVIDLLLETLAHMLLLKDVVIMDVNI